MAHFRLMNFVDGVVVMGSLVFDHSLPATSNCFDYLAAMQNNTHIRSNTKRK